MPRHIDFREGDLLLRIKSQVTDREGGKKKSEYPVVPRFTDQRNFLVGLTLFTEL
jgi:hypothetical protein